MNLQVENLNRIEKCMLTRAELIVYQLTRNFAHFRCAIAQSSDGALRRFYHLNVIIIHQLPLWLIIIVRIHEICVAACGLRLGKCRRVVCTWDDAFYTSSPCCTFFTFFASELNRFFISLMPFHQRFLFRRAHPCRWHVCDMQKQEFITKQNYHSWTLLINARGTLWFC